jgi:hypothetical protein
MTAPVYIVGDIHGQYGKLVRVLQKIGLIDETLSWQGGTAHLWFMGDFLDRGTDGLAAVELAMRLQREARAAGGDVQALLGNHEILFLSAIRFHKRGGFELAWLRNGGHAPELTRVTPEQTSWLSALPGVALCYDRLLLHADALFYTHYGLSVDQVNQSFARILQGDDAESWEMLLEDFSERMAFLPGRPDAIARAGRMLDLYGGKGLVHGHTPITYMRHDGALPEMITEAYAYNGGLCVNVDGGMYLGGPGFAYALA